jgi:hypothetical protein
VRKFRYAEGINDGEYRAKINALDEKLRLVARDRHEKDVDAQREAHLE